MNRKALVDFKRSYGHCRVPMSIPDLGKWAKYQRDQFTLYLLGKPSKITLCKIDKLKSIGFEDSIEERVETFLSESLTTGGVEVGGGG